MFLRSDFGLPLVALRRYVPVLSFTAGVCVGQVVAWFLAPSVIVAVGLMAGLLCLLRGVRVGGVVLGFLVGLSIAGWELATHPAPIVGSDVQVMVQVEDPPRRRVPGEVVFLGRELLGREGRLIRCRAVDLPWRNLSSVAQGDVVWIRGSALPIARPRNPFSWDGWMWRRGVSGEMRVLFASKAIGRSSSRLGGVRRWIVDAVKEATDDRRGGALFLSMAFGFRDVLSPPVENLFMKLGLSHLLVVSGYQVSLVFGFALAALTWLGRSVKATLGMRRIAIMLSLASALFYVAAIGTEMSSVRALLAAACLCLSLLLQRRHRFAQRLVVTFLCMHLVWPWAVFEIGVLLTFAALSGIGLGSVLGARCKWRSLAWVTISVWALTSAITVVWNGTFSTSGLVLNLALAAPWSVLNCTVGVGGLVLMLTGLPGTDLPVRAVAVTNELIVSALFWVQGVVGSPRQVSVYERVFTAFSLLTVSLVIALRALRRTRGLSLRSMVRGREARASHHAEKLK